jgi:hypothetical protein
MVTRHKHLVLASILGLAVALGFLLLATTVTVIPTPRVEEDESISPATTTIPVVSETPAFVFFTGDIMLARHVEVLLQQNLIQPYDFMSLFAKAKAVITNFESAMANPHVATHSGAMRFSTNVKSLELLKTLHISHASLANNHSRDYGRDGYVYAAASLRELGIQPFGDAVTVSSSSLSYIEVGSTTIAVLGIHTLFVPPDRTMMKNLLSEAKNNSDIQIVYIHWGDEYELFHNRNQEELATWFAAEGVDAIIGHHPHVVQDIALIGNMPVFYSLGNLVFDQYFSEDVKTGLVLGLEITPKSLHFTLYPQSQCAKATPCLMRKEAETAFLLGLADRSDEILFDQIVAKNIVIPR